MEVYEVWKAAMYTVGVFVTCNVGGLALMSVKKRLTRREPVYPEGAAVRMGVWTPKGMKVISNPEEIAAFLSKLSDADKAEVRPIFDHVRQTFDDIRRQIDTPEDVTAEDVTGATAKAADTDANPDKATDEKEDFFSD